MGERPKVGRAVQMVGKVLRGTAIKGGSAGTGGG